MIVGTVGLIHGAVTANTLEYTVTKLGMARAAAATPPPEQ